MVNHTCQLNLVTTTIQVVDVVVNLIWLFGETRKDCQVKYTLFLNPLIMQVWDCFHTVLKTANLKSVDNVFKQITKHLTHSCGMSLLDTWHVSSSGYPEVWALQVLSSLSHMFTRTTLRVLEPSVLILSDNNKIIKTTSGMLFSWNANAFHIWVPYAFFTTISHPINEI